MLLPVVTAVLVDSASATVGGEEGNATSAYQIWNAVRVLCNLIYYTTHYNTITILGNVLCSCDKFYDYIWFVCSYYRRVLHAAKRMPMSGRIRRNRM